ncbi:Non-histone chromosomal protein 6 family protein [Babesia bovis T2Bo]|uniref:High mobility group protein homolog NHP1 n=2 Tax=Babesia bovis TaxID=5865 RepID=NHP1_BABBO|nr:Non-histone chromosomal protein 6 family protein [Babesia bovis T2Bo]P40632.1 RecName: Full=High mobility group protein homolog NHP1 [Babesia bovis]2LHJ_A Chain A, High mobility group protein homolog NHP1 [Babesia bovis]AAA27799.1 non-histone protein [Babesia bovis]EDO05788.1 Non-histone chromosomal protein 6 family protein [Babesia bovis T2Bo]BAN64485.1 high mobility group protein-like protein NHP1 [Babesia bovis]|eukprot:XP_001609356.1 high mobility group protein-like protein NHP1 [Babesia bovis T2Bo]
MAGASDRTGVRRPRKAKKDPNAPKRALSSYMFFAKEKRVEIIAENPEIAKDVAAIGKMIGAAWNALSDEEKKPYERMSDEDRVRYEREKAEYAQRKV